MFTTSTTTVDFDIINLSSTSIMNHSKQRHLHWNIATMTQYINIPDHIKYTTN